MSEEPAAEPPFKAASDDHPELKEKLEQEAANPPRPGLSFTPGLQEVEGSKAPAMADGTEVSHVFGPQQAPVDPVAAGLDTSAHPLTRAENRVITQTGSLGAGQPPATYAEKGAKVPDVPNDGSTVPAAPDAKANAAPGPNSAP